MIQFNTHSLDKLQILKASAKICGICG